MAEEAAHDVVAAAVKLEEEAEEATKAVAADANLAFESAKDAVKGAVEDAKGAVEDAKDAVEDAAPASVSEWLPSKDGVMRGLADFKNVFLFPLCTGLMTGIGFVAGKRLAERYFYGPDVKVAVQ